MKKSQVTLDAWEQMLPNTLYNRLKEEQMKKLEGLATTFPSSFKIIVDEFKDTTIIYDADFHVIDCCRVMLGWDLNNLNQYFNSPS